MSRCPEKKDCRFWRRRDNETIAGCLKPRHVICCADVDDNEPDEDDDEVKELKF